MRIMKSKTLYESFQENLKESDAEWEQICITFCKKIGAELLFVNSDNFGYEDKDGNLVHMYADELAEYLSTHPFKEECEVKVKTPKKVIPKSKRKLKESVYALEPNNEGRNSYYGKALVEVNDDGETLTSYRTPIMNIKDGVVTMLCDEYALTNTTLRHIREFLKQHNLEPMTKQQLVKLINEQHSDLTEQDATIRINAKGDDGEREYSIVDITELNPVADGDVQAPLDISELLVNVDSKLSESYGENWGEINFQSTRFNNDTKDSNALFELNVGDKTYLMSMLLEENGTVLKVNNTKGKTIFKRKSNDIVGLTESYIKQFIPKEEKNVPDVIKHINADLHDALNFLKLQIELGKDVPKGEKEAFDKYLQTQIYAFVAEVSDEIKASEPTEDNKLELPSFDKMVEEIFGKQWVKKEPEQKKLELDGVEEIKESANLKEDEQVGLWVNGKVYWEGNKSEVDDTLLMDIADQASEEDGKTYDSDEVDIKPLKEADERLERRYDSMNESNKLNLNEEEFIAYVDHWGRSGDAKQRKVTASTAKGLVQKLRKLRNNPDFQWYKCDYVSHNFNDYESSVGKSLDELINSDEEIPSLKEADEPEVEASEETKVEEPKEETEPEEPKNGLGTGNATFARKPQTLEEVESKSKSFTSGDSSYLICSKEKLSKDEFDELQENLTTPNSYCRDFKPIDTDNYAFNVIEFSCPDYNYKLLVDPSDSDYCKYVSKVGE